MLRFPGNITQGGEDHTMEEPTNDAASQEQAPEETLGRRQLLKALAATGGAAAAASLLPGKWAKPVIEAGVLPAHAQVSPTPQPTEQPTQEPLEYSVLCDSQPGGGDLNLVDGLIQQIQPLIAVISGTGPVENITATMTATAVSGALPTFNPTLPQIAVTNALGRAIFGDLQVTGSPGQQFLLVFDFAVPSGTAHAECGIFFFGQQPPM
jgi:hypothetical protein